MRSQVVMAIVCIGITACSAVTGSSGRLGPVTAETTTGVRAAKVGTLYSFGLTPLEPSGDDPVALVRAELTGVSPGLEVVAVRAVSRATSPNDIGSMAGEPTRDPSVVFVPLSDVTFESGKPETFFLLATVRPRTTGLLRATGLRVTYTSGGVERSALYKYAIELEVDGRGPDPRASAPVR